MCSERAREGDDGNLRFITGGEGEHSPVGAQTGDGGRGTLPQPGHHLLILPVSLVWSALALVGLSVQWAMARQLGEKERGWVPTTVARESHSQPHTEALAQSHTFLRWGSDPRPQSPDSEPHPARCTDSRTRRVPHSRGQGHRLKTTPHTLPPEITHIPPPPSPS